MNLLRGKHLTPEGTEGFYEICRELHDFTGALRLSGKVKGDFCQADLLVDAGYIVAVSFEDLEKREILLREAALDEIRTNFVKSVGSLDISELKKDELKTALDENETALLDSLIPLTILGMKIKPIEKTTVKEPKKKRHWLFGLGGKGKEKKKKEDIVRTELPKKKFKSGVGAQSPSNVAAIMGSGGKTAGAANANTKAGTGQGGQDLAGLMGSLGKGDSVKSERLTELKKQRELQNRALIKKHSQLTEGAPKKSTILEGKTVATSIDQLYNMVQKYKRLRINDALARKLRVKRSQIEGWAMILEEHNLIELHYPTIGEPEIRKIEKK